MHKSINAIQNINAFKGKSHMIISTVAKKKSSQKCDSHYDQGHREARDVEECLYMMKVVCDKLSQYHHARGSAVHFFKSLLYRVSKALTRTMK